MFLPSFISSKVIGLSAIILLSAWITLSPVPPRNHSDSEQALYTLGKSLFFERKLSLTNAKSCGSCHNPKIAFTDHYRRGSGLHAELLPRNTPSLINVRYFRTFNWANPDLTRLEAQFERPLFNQHPPEMGLTRSDEDLQRRLSVINEYNVLFKQAFPTQQSPMNWTNALVAIRVFVESLTSFNSPYDQFQRGNKKAMSASARRGEVLFKSTRLQCATCHPAPYFTDSFAGSPRDGFANIGLYNINGTGDYPAFDQGIFNFSQKPEDKGKFRTPSLRNVELTAPYMHDGSVETLDEALTILGNGGRDLHVGEYTGDGRANPYKDPLMKGFTLTDQERRDLLAFLYALTDSSILTNRNFQAPPPLGEETLGYK
jgi:cytochrome c peroxidase